MPMVQVSAVFCNHLNSCRSFKYKFNYYIKMIKLFNMQQCWGKIGGVGSGGWERKTNIFRMNNYTFILSTKIINSYQSFSMLQNNDQFHV